MVVGVVVEALELDVHLQPGHHAVAGRGERPAGDGAGALRRRGGDDGDAAAGTGVEQAAQGLRQVTGRVAGAEDDLGGPLVAAEAAAARLARGRRARLDEGVAHGRVAALEGRDGVFEVRVDDEPVVGDGRELLRHPDDVDADAVGERGEGELQRERPQHLRDIVRLARDVQQADRLEVDQDRRSVGGLTEADQRGVRRGDDGRRLRAEQARGVGGAPPHRGRVRGAERGDRRRGGDQVQLHGVGRGDPRDVDRGQPPPLPCDVAGHAAQRAPEQVEVADGLLGDRRDPRPRGRQRRHVRAGGRRHRHRRERGRRNGRERGDGRLERGLRQRPQRLRLRWLRRSAGGAVLGRLTRRHRPSAGSAQRDGAEQHRTQHAGACGDGELRRRLVPAVVGRGGGRRGRRRVSGGRRVRRGLRGRAAAAAVGEHSPAVGRRGARARAPGRVGARARARAVAVRGRHRRRCRRARGGLRAVRLGDGEPHAGLDQVRIGEPHPVRRGHAAVGVVELRPVRGAAQFPFGDPGERVARTDRHLSVMGGGRRRR